jgi:hypothetical protein
LKNVRREIPAAATMSSTDTASKPRSVINRSAAACTRRQVSRFLRSRTGLATTMNPTVRRLHSVQLALGA